MHRHVADLIQKQRAAVRCLEAAYALRDRSSERAPLVAEKLAFEQVRGDRCAVHLDEGPLPSFTLKVDAARDEFLTRTGFAFNQHRNVGGRHNPNLI
jgi:hypothetical protein